MEEVTLEENNEEDSCLDMLATQNAEQFTPQMLAITKAQVKHKYAQKSSSLIPFLQDEQQAAEDATMMAMSEAMPEMLDMLGEWQNLFNRSDEDKNADMQEIIRLMLEKIQPFEQHLDKIKRE